MFEIRSLSFEDALEGPDDGVVEEKVVAAAKVGGIKQMFGSLLTPFRVESAPKSGGGSVAYPAPANAPEAT